MANRERLVSTLMDLIRIDSPTGEEDEMDREVTARLQSLGFRVEHDSFNNVIAKLDGDGEPVILSAHLDTVEPGRGIRPQLDGDLLRSDGTTILGGDCKAGVAIVLEAMTSALESGLEPGSESGQKSGRKSSRATCPIYRPIYRLRWCLPGLRRADWWERTTWTLTGLLPGAEWCLTARDR